MRVSKCKDITGAPNLWFHYPVAVKDASFTSLENAKVALTPPAKA